MRKLQTHDVFMALKIIRVAGVKDEVRRIALLVKEKENKKEKIRIEDVGVEFIFGCLEKLSGDESEKAIYDFLSGPLEMESQEIKSMDPFVLMEHIMNLKEVIDLEKAKNFLKSLAALAEKMN